MGRRTTQWFWIIAVISLTFSVASAQETTPQYSHKQLKKLMDTAATADDYQKLASYFHYEELLYRNKAQQALNETSQRSAKYPMATKTVTRAEVDSRTYKDYVNRADEYERHAAKYDELLVGMGIKPTKVSPTVVSAKSAQKSPPGAVSSALMDTSTKN